MKKLNRVGEKYQTKEGYEVEIVEYFSAINCTIRFNDVHNTILKYVFFQHVKEGTTTNPNHKSVFGIGYFGIGKYKSRINGKQTRNYVIWQHMIRRCYSEVALKKKKSYSDCSVHPDWHNFQTFSKWFEENYIEGYELDKDILVKGNKIYMPETCVFVPHHINLLFKKYRHGTEKRIKEVAEIWKDRIDPRVYNIMINYKKNNNLN